MSELAQRITSKLNTEIPLLDLGSLYATGALSCYSALLGFLVRV